MPDLSRHISRPLASSQADIDDMNDALDRRFARERQGMGSNNTFNGSTKYVNAMLAVITALMVAAVCGMWGMYGKVEALSVKVEDVKGTVDLIVAGKIKP
jgi:hypothetical protein